MFKVDVTSNRIVPIKMRTFHEFGFTERNHLQEWLANEPNALGEELLIIQKEFDGFDDTRERLDLLALDKDGNIVIIENKLDDSGRDVVWQALKYASYASSLTKSQLVNIYQQHLDKEYTGSENAEKAITRICEFLNIPDFDEVIVNTGNSQRIMLVAANFRKEVTSTAIWLLGQGIKVQCFKVTPYSLDGEALINIDQIVPTPEAKELIISMTAKDAEEKNTERVQRDRYGVRLKYWENTLEVFHNSNFKLYDNINPGKDHWLSAGSGVTGCPFNLLILKKELRVELWISKASKEENKQIFDYLHERKDPIEAKFGGALDWMRLDDKKSCRIQFSYEADGFNSDHWDEYAKWHLEHMQRLQTALKEPLLKANKAVKQEL